MALVASPCLLDPQILCLEAVPFKGAGHNQMGSMKIVSSCFYRPSGEGFQQRGVKSDIMLPSLMNEVFAGDQGLKGALAFDRIPRAGFQPVGWENEAKMTKLRKQSES